MELVAGLMDALSFLNLLYVFLGVALGIIVGGIPGLSARQYPPEPDSRGNMRQGNNNPRPFGRGIRPGLPEATSQNDVAVPTTREKPPQGRGCQRFAALSSSSSALHCSAFMPVPGRLASFLALQP